MRRCVGSLDSPLVQRRIFRRWVLCVAPTAASTSTPALLLHHNIEFFGWPLRATNSRTWLPCVLLRDDQIPNFDLPRAQRGFRGSGSLPPAEGRAGAALLLGEGMPETTVANTGTMPHPAWFEFCRTDEGRAEYWRRFGDYLFQDPPREMPPELRAALAAPPPARRPRSRRQRKPSIAALVKRAEKSGHRVTSVTMADGTVLHFGEPAPVEASNPWPLDDFKVTRQ